MHFIFCQDPTCKNGYFLETHNTEGYEQDLMRCVDRPTIQFSGVKVYLILFLCIIIKTNRCCVISLAQYTFFFFFFFFFDSVY